MSGKQIGILTGGGDCPGLNAVIRAVVRRAVVNFGWSVLGIKEGWRGLLDDHLTDPLNLSSVSGILHRGGTILKTSRTNPAAVEGGMERVARRLNQLQLHGLVAVGGDDQFLLHHLVPAIRRYSWLIPHQPATLLLNLRA